ncbi:MAG TPA: hypothetical protein VGK67_16010 [Myxococcales bacterium]|jgi:hypothetical protein
MFLAPWLVLAALLGGDPSAGSGGAAPARQVVDRIVAILDNRPLLLSELEFEARVALIQQGGVLAASAALSDEDLASALEWAIGQRLALAEADRLQVFDVDAPDVAKELKSFEVQMAGPRKLAAFLASQEATQSQLSAVLQRGLRVQRFLDTKVKLSSRVTEEDVARYYAIHAGELGGQPYERLREGIKAQLARERSRTMTKKQLDDLRAKADVRIVAPFARQPAAPDGAPTKP